MALRTETRDADVAVVGAGLAGLTAARRLVEAGVEPIVVEARDRVGGIPGGDVEATLAAVAELL